MIDQLAGMQQLIQHSDLATISFGAKLLKRRIPTLIIILSLLLTCGILMSWVRSFFVRDSVYWRPEIPMKVQVAQRIWGLNADCGMLSIYRIHLIPLNTSGVQFLQDNLWDIALGWSHTTWKQRPWSWEMLTSSIRQPGKTSATSSAGTGLIYTHREFLIAHWLLSLLTSTPAMIILLRRLIRRRRLRQTGFEVVSAPK